MTVTPAIRTIEPTWHSVPATSVLTLGPAVADLCAKSGLEPEPEQQQILDAIFAFRDDGLPAAFEVAIIGPRQLAGKTATILMAEIGWIYVTEEPLVLHTAHRAFAVESAFRALRKLIRESPHLSARLAPGRSRGINTAHGDEAIEFRTGQRIEYATRTGDSGRSLTAPKVVGDEWYAATADHAGAILPTLAAVPEAQVLLASSAGKKTSAVLRGVRDRGRTGGRGGRGADPRLAYFETTDPDAWAGCESGRDCAHAVGAAGCALDDRDRWRRLFSGLHHGRGTLETVRSLRNAMPPEEFARELLGWWDDPDDLLAGVFGGAWGECRDEKSAIVSDLRFALDVNPSLSWAAIGVAGLTGERNLHLEVTSRGAGDGPRVVDHRPGTDWVVPRLAQLGEAWHGFRIVIVKRSPAASLIPAIERAGITVEELPADQVPAACGLIYSKVGDGSVRHLGQPALDEAAKATRKNVEDGETAWRYGRRRSTSDITPIYAVTFAGWVADRDLAADYDVADSLY